jgi:hypothetical protein
MPAATTLPRWQRLARDVTSVRIVSVPKTWPDGWDLADPPPDGVTVEKLRKL